MINKQNLNRQQLPKRTCEPITSMLPDLLSGNHPFCEPESILYDYVP
jgi:hypothetical protein